MTTSAAICLPQFEIAAIGADGQITDGDKISKLTAVKYVVKNGIGFVFAGSAYGGVTASRILKKIIPENQIPNFRDIVLEFHKKTFDEIGSEAAASGILVSKDGLYAVSTSDIPLSVDPYQKYGINVLAEAEGSGGEYALGSLYSAIGPALKLEFGNELVEGVKPKNNQRTRVRMENVLRSVVTEAIHAGIHYDRNSGGKPTVSILK